MRVEAVNEEIQNLDNYHRQIDGWKRLSRDEVVITTLEGHELRVAVSRKGWDLVESDKEPYMTVESLLMDTSPLFKREWDNELRSRLEALTKS